MQKDLKLIPLEKAHYSFAKKLYEEAFPIDERREFDVAKNLTHSFSCQFLIILRDSEAVGLIVLWSFRNFDYIEHFAIDTKLRNTGIGRKILQNLLEKSQKQIVFEVELPANEVTAKRIAFYEKSGFYTNNQHYIQPAYSNGKKEIPMLLMSRKPLNNKAFKEVVIQLKNSVYLLLPE